MKLTIFRHGETHNNRAEIFQNISGDLTPEGLESAKKLGMRLKDEIYTIIYSSDIDRAKQTVAEVLTYHPNTPITYLEILRERSVGALAGRPKTEFDARNLPPDYETDDMAVYRAKKFVQEYIEPRVHSDDNILISTHGAFSRMLMTTLFNHPDKHPNNVGGISNTGVTMFEYSKENGWEKTLDNCTVHLE